MFKTGDYVFYFRKVDATFETVPAKVLQVNAKTLKVEANFNEGTRTTRVSKTKCELQNG